MKSAKSILKRDAGIALLTTLLLLLMMSSLMVGFILMVIGGARLAGLNDDYSKAYYASEAGMEKITADLGTLFDANYSPSGAQVNALTIAPPTIADVQYIDAKTGGPGYTITFPTDPNGNPLATNSIVNSGPYQGMVALATPYTLTVTAHTDNGSEVKLQRTTQTVGIPMFQFGIFSDSDLSFFPGPKFSFGGRTSTNGNLFLAAGTELDMLDRVTAHGDVIRTNLSNGFPAPGQYNGPINIATSSGTNPPLRSLAFTEGSLLGTLGSPPNPNWQSISLGSGNYNGFLRGGTTAPSQKLNLGVVTVGNGITQQIDINRRPPGPENNAVTAERYFAQASMQILLSDNPTDIMNLPCVDPSVQPFNLADIAQPVASWTSSNAAALKTLMTNNNSAGLNTPPIPLAVSGASSTATSYNSTNGYWQPANTPIIKGYIKIEVQKGYGNPCGSWKDVTIEVLGLGYVGKNVNPMVPGGGIVASPSLNALPKLSNNPLGQLSQVDNPAAVEALVPTECYQRDPHPNAIVRLERIRDNPSNASTTNGCGVVFSGGLISVGPPPNPTDYWPNTLFDTREGALRDFAPSSTSGVGTIAYNQMVSLSGVMQYIEIDANNVARYFHGAIGSSGNLAFDPNTAPNDFTVYVSDRRGNYANVQSWTGSWPPLSPGLHETGEYGNTDVVNAITSPTAGCPNNAMETGEDIDQTGQGYYYGEDPTQVLKAYNAGSPWTGGNGYYTNILTTSPFTSNPFCSSSPAVPNTSLWPGTYVINSNEARENPNPFFRRAIKIVHGSSLNLGNCPGSTSNSTIPCGLTIASENPAYVQGDFNANSLGNGWNDPHVATSVSADAVTLLSDNWNDYNSFLFPYQMAAAASSPSPVTAGSLGQRGGYTTFYRLAIAAGKTVSFPQPGGTAQDFGTDGGVHNFLRYIENWGGQTLNYRGSIINLFYSRQAVGIFKCCTLVYSPPSRGYQFDVEFLDPQLLPPRTPLFRDINTTGFTQMLLPNQ
jgi:hypothetical protein